MKSKTIPYYLISASGNPTAIVNGCYNSADKKNINQSIFSSNKLVEQIGYIFTNNSNKYFEMMGDEFSGNGCRAAAFVYCNFKPGTVDFYSSGTKKIINGIIKNNLNTSITIPYQFSINQLIPLTGYPFLIKMLNSYLLVIEGKGSLPEADLIIKRSFSQTKAAGIMYIQKIKSNVYKLNPFFWVKNTQTLVNETACGSGSIASAIYLSSINKQSFYNLQLVQPSGLPIMVTTNYDNGVINNLTISGPTKMLGIYNVKIKL